MDLPARPARRATRGERQDPPRRDDLRGEAGDREDEGRDDAADRVLRSARAPRRLRGRVPLPGPDAGPRPVARRPGPDGPAGEPLPRGQRGPGAPRGQGLARDEGQVATLSALTTATR